MLITAESSLQKKTKEVMMVLKGSTSFKKASGSVVKSSTPTGGKGKGPMGKPAPKGKGKAKLNVKDAVCYFCNQRGHWKRDCRKFLEEQKKVGSAGASGIYYIEVNLSTKSGWILDTGSQSHICVDVQALTSRRDLAGDEADIRVADGKRVVATAVGTIRLSLPSGLLLVLNNVYCVPNFRKDIISRNPTAF